MTKGNLKMRRKRARIMKRVAITSLCTVCIAAIVAVTASILQNNSSKDLYKAEESVDVLSAGISGDMNEILRTAISEEQSTIVKAETNLVHAANPEAVETDIQSCVENFYAWCTSSDQLSIDIQHSFVMNGIETELASMSSQTDNSTLQSHVVTHKPNYDLDMWYNQANNTYYVNLYNDTTDVDWTIVDNSSSSLLRDLCSKHVIYQTTTNTVQEILSGILESGTYTLTPGPREDTYSIFYESESLDGWNIQPTFYNGSNLTNWCVLVQHVGNCYCIDLQFIYSDLNIQSETISYVFEPTNSCNLDLPLTVSEATNNTDDLLSLYHEILEE